MSFRSIMIAATTAAITLCFVSEPGSAQIPTWRVAPSATTIIGGGQGDVATEPLRVSSAHLLRDGRVVVANGNPLELRLYSPAGRFLRRLGQQGNGPGEFASNLMVFGVPGDSLLTYTGGGRRWALFTPTTHVREWAASGSLLPSDLMLFKNTFAVRGVHSSSACVQSLTDRLPPHGDTLRQVIPDAKGRYWTRVMGAPEWVVYSISGKALGRVSLPPATELLEVGDKALVVKARDADDLERVEVWEVGIPPGAEPDSDPCHQAPDALQQSPTGLARAKLLTDLRNMQVAGRTFFGRTGRYPRTLEEFGISLSTRSAEMIMLANNPRGWGAKFIDREEGVFCIGFAGDGVLPGWPTDRVACGLLANSP